MWDKEIAVDQVRTITLKGKIFFGEKYLRPSLQRTTNPTRIAPAGSVLICVRAPVGVVNITTREL